MFEFLKLAAVGVFSLSVSACQSGLFVCLLRVFVNIFAFKRHFEEGGGGISVVMQ